MPNPTPLTRDSHPPANAVDTDALTDEEVAQAAEADGDATSQFASPGQPLGDDDGSTTE